MLPVSALFSAAHEEHSGGPSPCLPTLTGIPDAELIQRLHASDETVYGLLYETYFPRLTAIASGYVTRAEAEELAQDVLAYAWERRTDWSDGDSLGIYLYASVRNRALKIVRHQKVVARLGYAVDATPPGMGSAPISAERRLNREAIRAAVDTVLAGLPEGARTAFLLRWMHELSYPEIAQIMSTTEATVRQQVAKARRAVVPVLEQFARE